jgi:hypothetical protein
MLFEVFVESELSVLHVLQNVTIHMLLVFNCILMLGFGKQDLK